MYSKSISQMALILMGFTQTFMILKKVFQVQPAKSSVNVNIVGAHRIYLKIWTIQIKQKFWQI